VALSLKKDLPSPLYASETWTLTKRDRKHLNIFERKVYRRILSPVYDKEKRKLEDINQ